MANVWIALGVVVGLFVLWLVVVGITGSGIKTPRVPSSSPAKTPDEALAKLKALQTKDTDQIAGPCGSALYEPDGPVKATLIYFHGFTNCPHQFAPIVPLLTAQGYRVLAPRQPGHGHADVLTHALKDLSVDELTQHVSDVLDIASGWSDPVFVTGLSGGGVLAAWAAATRRVDRALLMAPFVAPTGFPNFAVRLMIRFRGVIPGLYWWWDPRKKADLGESPYVYPGFPLPGMVPFMHLANALRSKKIVITDAPAYAGLTTNPGDFAIRKDAARDLFVDEFTGHAATMVEWTLDKDLGWWHDFIDQDGSNHGDPAQIAEVMLTALGVSDQGATDGLMTADTLGGGR